MFFYCKLLKWRAEEVLIAYLATRYTHALPVVVELIRAAVNTAVAAHQADQFT